MAKGIDVRAAIQSGDAEALRRLLAEDKSRANTLIRRGKNDCILTHPLYYVSDMLFEGTLKKGQGIATDRMIAPSLSYSATK